MKLFASYLSGKKILVLMFIVLAGVAQNSCKKKTFTKPVNLATIRFDASAYTIERNSPEALTIVLPLSLPLEEDATAVVFVDKQSTAADSNYTITPLVPDGGITLNLAKGATEASFKIASSDNFEGDLTVVLNLMSATGGVTVANTNATTTINIKGKPIILPEIKPSETTLPSFGNVITTTSSPSQSYTITGVKLTSNINLVASDNFQISLDSVNFGTSQTIDFASANAGPVNVYVKFVPNSGQNQIITGTISHSSGTVPGAIVNVSGTEYGNALPGELLMSDNFDYGAAGDLTAVSGGNWNVFSGTLNPIQYSSTGLSFAGYAGSGVGGAITSENGSGSRQDVFETFPSQSSGTIYISQLINAASAPAGNDFFTSMRDGSSYINRIYFHDNAGKLSIGVGKSSATVAYSTTDFNYGTTYLLVSKYDFSSGVSSIYVLENGLTSLEPPTPTASTNAGTSPSAVENLIIRQNTTKPLTVTFDGIRVATSWKEAVGL